MKKLITLFFIIISIHSFSQIEIGYGLFPMDTCNFETSNTRLTIDTTNTNNDWQIGSTNKPFFGQANSLPNAIMTDTLNSYSSNNLSYFDLGFNIYNDGWMMNLYVQFDHKYETDSLIDGGFITVSYDSGQTWINVISDTCDFCMSYPNINSENLYTYNDTLKNGNYGFSGTSDWITTKMQWIFFMVVKQQLTDTFTLRFNFISDSIQSNKDGWIIDNIIVGYADFGSSVIELTNGLEVKLYPNITTAYFNYEVERSDEISTLIITNVIGENVLQITNPNKKGKVDVSNLPSGNYFVKFIGQGKQTVKRLVIN